MKTGDRNGTQQFDWERWTTLSKYSRTRSAGISLPSPGCASAISYFNNQIDTYLLVISFGWMIVPTFCSLILSWLQIATCDSRCATKRLRFVAVQGASSYCLIGCPSCAAIHCNPVIACITFKNIHSPTHRIVLDASVLHGGRLGELVVLRIFCESSMIRNLVRPLG